MDFYLIVNNSTKRPTTDRFFTPNEKDDETKEAFLTCPPAACVDQKIRKLLESKPFVKSIIGSKKYLDLPLPFFDEKRITFKEVPLFAITEQHAKLSLGNLTAMSQLYTGIQDYLSWIIKHFELKKDMSSYDGTSSQERRFLRIL